MEKQNRPLGTILLVCGLLLGGAFIYIMVGQSNLNASNAELENENNKLKAELAEKPTEVEVEVHDTVYVSMFDDATSVYGYVYPRFKVFNREIDSLSVEKFVEVMNYYELDTTQEMIELYVGQILLESGAKQYYPSGHPRSGKLVESYAGAIGFCQIMPNTCYGYMTKHMSSDNVQEVANLGGTDFEFAFDENIPRYEKVRMCRDWLTNETNNMIMWGFITKNNIDRKGDIIKQLVSYNAGTGGMQKYINNGGVLERHDYIRGIHKKLNYVSDALEEDSQDI